MHSHIQMKVASLMSVDRTLIQGAHSFHPRDQFAKKHKIIKSFKFLAKKTPSQEGVWQDYLTSVAYDVKLYEVKVLTSDMPVRTATRVTDATSLTVSIVPATVKPVVVKR